MFEVTAEAPEVAAAALGSDDLSEILDGHIEPDSAGVMSMHAPGRRGGPGIMYQSTSSEGVQAPRPFTLHQSGESTKDRHVHPAYCGVTSEIARGRSRPSRCCGK